MTFRRQFVELSKADSSGVVQIDTGLCVYALRS